MSQRYFHPWRRSLGVFAMVLAFAVMASQTTYAAPPISLTSHAATGRLPSRISHGASNAFPPKTITIQTGANPPLLLCYNSSTNQITARGALTSTDPTCRFTLAQVASGSGTGMITLQASNHKYLAITGSSKKEIQASEPTTNNATSQFFMIWLLSIHQFAFQSSAGFYLDSSNIDGKTLAADSTYVSMNNNQFTLKEVS